MLPQVAVRVVVPADVVAVRQEPLGDVQRKSHGEIEVPRDLDVASERFDSPVELLV